MKNLIRILLVLMIVTPMLAIFPASAKAETIPVKAPQVQSQVGSDSPVIFGQNYTLSSGQSINDLIVFGGNAVIMSGSRVTGDVLIFGGNLDVSGTVQGGITSFGGNVTINDKAIVTGVINTVGGNRFISPEAKIGGQISDPSQLPFRFPITIFGPTSSINLGPGVTLIWAVFLSLILAALAVVVSLFLPHPTANVAQTLTGEPIISGGVGLLTLVIAPAIFLVLAITIVLIPLAALFILVFGVTMVFGWIAMGMALGERLASLFRAQWAVPVSAGIGTLTLSMLTNLTISLTSASFWTLCCLGVPIILLLNIISLGAVISSRYGVQRYTTRLHPQPPMPPTPMSTSPALEPVAPALPDLTPIPVEEPSTPPEPPADLNDQTMP